MKSKNVFYPLFCILFLCASFLIKFETSSTSDAISMSAIFSDDEGGYEEELDEYNKEKGKEDDESSDETEEANEGGDEYEDEDW